MNRRCIFIRHKISTWIEINYTWLLATLLGLLTLLSYLIFEFDITSSVNFQSMLDAIINFVSITTGIMGVLLTIVVSNKESSAMIIYFFDAADESFFVNCLKKQFASGICVVLVSAILYLEDIIIFSFAVSVIWVWLLVYFAASTFKFMCLLIQLVIQKKINPQKPVNYRTSESEREEILKKLEK